MRHTRHTANQEFRRSDISRLNLLIRILNNIDFTGGFILSVQTTRPETDAICVRLGLSEEIVDTKPIRGLLRYFRTAAYKEPAEASGDIIIFRFSRPARYFFCFGILFVGMMCLVSFLVKGVPRYFALAFALAFLATFLRWPWSIRMDRVGISTRSYFGIRKTIRWPEVASFDHDPKRGGASVLSSTGQRIRCSPFMVSPATFYKEIYQRAPALGAMPMRKANFAQLSV